MRFRALPIVPLAVAAAACGSSSTNSGSASSTTSTAPRAPAGLSTRPLSGLGTVIVNQSGRTLYVFTPEMGGKLACTGSCATTWPPLTTKGQAPTVESTHVHPALVGTVAAPSGGKIVTYAGWPLHTYSGDSAAGDVKGQGISGQWYVISPSGQVNKRKASSSTSHATGY